MLSLIKNTILDSIMLPFLHKNANPQSLIFFVTSRCNATCDFCLYKSFLNDQESIRNELSISEIHNITKNYGNLHFLTLSGGEPFVRNDLYELCREFIVNCNTKVIDIPSNCFYTQRTVDVLTRLCRDFPHVQFQLQVSIDDIGEAHDLSRGVKGLYKKAMQTINLLCDMKLSNLKLNANVVYLDINKNRIHHILSTVKKDFNLDRVTLGYLNRLIPNQGSKSEVGKYLEFKNVSDSTLSHSKSLNLFVLGMKSATLFTNQMLLKAISGSVVTSSYCEAGRNFVVLSETGKVYPCEPLWHDIGNVRDHNYSMRSVLSSPRYLQFKSKMLNSRNCNCTWSCAVTSSIPRKKKFTLKVIFLSFKLIFSSFRISQ